MRKKYPRLALFGALALALGAIAGTGSAQAAKVTSTAAGGALADAPAPSGGITRDGTPLTQTFNLSGVDVTKMQVKDVNLTLNSTGSADNANTGFRAKLIAPSGDNFGFFITGLFTGPGNFGKDLMNLKLDDQSDLVLCDPLAFSASDCNFLTGSTATGGGTATGTVGTGAGLLNQFRGISPEGAWRLIWWDTANLVTHTIGTATLEVTTGKRFAKEGKKKKKKKKKKK